MLPCVGCVQAFIERSAPSKKQKKGQKMGLTRSILRSTYFAALFLWTCTFVTATAGQLHNFYGLADVHTKSAFLTRLQSPHLRMKREQLVELFNSQYGSRIGKVANFEGLLHILAGENFIVQPCGGTVTGFGVTDVGGFDSVTRGCYLHEDMLVEVKTHISVFSLACGNLQVPPPLPPPLRQVWVSPPGIVWGINKCGVSRHPCIDQLVIINNGSMRVSPNYID